MTHPRLALPALLAAAGLLAACATPPASAPSLTPTEQFATQVRPGADEIQLAPNGALSVRQSAAVAALVARWREFGDGQIVVQGPVDGAGAATAQAAVDALLARGVPPPSIRMAVLENPEAGIVRVGFGRLEAVVHDCSTLWDDLVRTAENRPAASFGCAVTSNAAAQIADPRDIVQPSPVQAADSRRRVLQLNSYREGDDPVQDSSSAGPQQ